MPRGTPTKQARATVKRQLPARKVGKTPPVKKPQTIKKPGIKPVKAPVTRKRTTRKPAPAVPPVTVETAEVSPHTVEVAPVVDSNGVVVVQPVPQAQ